MFSTDMGYADDLNLSHHPMNTETSILSYYNGEAVMWLSEMTVHQIAEGV